MTAPERRGLPRSTKAGLLERPHLLEVLDGRFDRRLTVLRAGAGFGKTTTLLQAIERNQREPRGTDFWIRCRPVDDRPREFEASLRHSVGADGSRGDVVQNVCDALWASSPDDVALIIDDVHVLTPDGASAATLGRVLDSLPDNAHLVLASRDRVPVATARLEAAGDAVVLDEASFVFTGEEQTAFLASRSGAAGVGDLGGWPALLELFASAGVGRVGDFLWEEVLHGLPEGRARDLARLAPLEWVDDARIEAFTGAPVPVAEFVGGLPLTRIDDDGRAHFHSLWTRVLGEADPQWDPESLTRAVNALTESGDHREALELCLAHGGPAMVSALAERFTAHSAEHLRRAPVETFLHLLPADIRRSPVGRLLEGRLRMRDDPAAALPHLVAAREGFSASRRGDLELATLALLTQAGFSMWDPEVLAELRDRAREIDTTAARSLAAMIEATRATVVGAPWAEVRAGLEEAREEGGPLGGTDGVVAGVASRSAGSPDEGLPFVERALAESTRANRALLVANRFDCLWLLGRVPPDLIATFDAGPEDGLAEMRHQGAAVSGLMAFSNAILGRRVQARRHLERAESLQHAAVRDTRDIPLVARMAIEILEGDEAAAARVVEDRLDETALHEFGPARGLPMAVIVSKVLRTRFEDHAFGPCFEHGRVAARALIAAREEGEFESAAALSWDDPAPFATYLVTSLMLELAIAGAVGGNPGALAYARGLAENDREVLRRLAGEGPAEMRKIASTLSREIPARPRATVRMQTLGSFSLFRDGVELEDPLLRRGRVRAMLQFLATRGSCRRDELGAALWPDFDQEAMANNLRVNLSHAARLLEPERLRGEPSYLLATTGDRIGLRFGDALVLDTVLFEERLDAAERADGSGDPATTLALLDAAIGLYGGEFLADAPEPEWGEAERTRLRHRFVRAALRAGQLRLGHGDLDVAATLAARAGEAEEFNEEAMRLQALVYLRASDPAAARSALEAGIARLRDAGLGVGADTQRLALRLGIPTG